MINEILSHTDGYPNDWVELLNTTDEPIYIGNWYLSDDPFNRTKYKIPEGLWLGSHAYVVLTQDDDFGGAFALSEHGEVLYLTSGDGVQVTGYSEEEAFGASQNGVAFGRYRASTGSFNFMAMSTNTSGTSYAGPDSDVKFYMFELEPME